jgi:hypothetical protein
VPTALAEIWYEMGALVEDPFGFLLSTAKSWWSPVASFDAPAEVRAAAAKMAAAGREHLLAARCAEDQRMPGSAASLYGKAISFFSSAKSMLVDRKVPEGVASSDPAEVVRSASAAWITTEQRADAISLLTDPKSVTTFGWLRRRRALACLLRLSTSLGREVRACGDRELTVLRTKRQVGTVLLASVIVGLLLAWAKLPKNVARGKPVTASSVRMGAPQALTNGAIEWGTFGLHTGSSGREWAMVDLQKFYSLDSAEVYSRGEGRFEFNLPLTVETSADGVSFQPGGVCSEIFTQATPCVVQLHRVRARFVRVSAAEVVLSEVEVYGK